VQTASPCSGRQVAHAAVTCGSSAACSAAVNRSMVLQSTTTGMHHTVPGHNVRTMHVQSRQLTSHRVRRVIRATAVLTKENKCCVLLLQEQKDADEAAWRPPTRSDSRLQRKNGSPVSAAVRSAGHPRRLALQQCAHGNGSSCTHSLLPPPYHAATACIGVCPSTDGGIHVG